MIKLLRIASILDESGQYELSDKLFKIAQKNVVQQGVANAVGGGQVTKTTYDHGKAAVDIVSFLTKYFKQNIPIFIQTLNTVKSSLHKFENIPAIDKILGALDLKSFIEDTIEFLNKVNTMGFMNYYQTDAKGVLQFFISLISTINQLAGYIPILAPMKIQLQAIDASMNALNTMVTIADISGSYMGTTNTSLRNFTNLKNPNELPVLGYSLVGTNMDNRKLTAIGGEVHNVLVDYVLKKGPLRTLIDKHIPDGDPEKAEKEAQILSAIKQNKLPDPKLGYSKSSYKQKAEQEEYYKTHPDASFDNYQLQEWQAMQTLNRFVNKNVVSPIQQGVKSLVRNYNNSIPQGSNIGYVNPIVQRDIGKQR